MPSNKDTGNTRFAQFSKCCERMKRSSAGFEGFVSRLRELGYEHRPRVMYMVEEWTHTVHEANAKLV